MGFWLGTLVFFIIQIVSTAGVNYFGKPGNKGLTHIMCFTTVFQLWFIWAIIYLAQMNPLVNPEFKE